MHQLEMMHPVPGRMHCMGGERDQPVVVVDFAHTPDAFFLERHVTHSKHFVNKQNFRLHMCRYGKC